MYVHNRVQRIRQSTVPEQWHFVPTNQNPADIATRSVSASQLANTQWFKGPDFLHKPLTVQQETQKTFELVMPELDGEIRPHVTSFVTLTEERHLTSERFKRFSSWKALLRATALLIHIVRSFKPISNTHTNECRGWHICKRVRTPEELLAAKLVILKSVQKETFHDDFSALAEQRNIPRSSALKKTQSSDPQ